MSTIEPTPELNDDLSDNLSDDLSIVDSIETVIESLDSTNSAMVSHGNDGHLWKFQYGNVEVFVQLTGVAAEDIFTVWAKVLNLPIAQEAHLMRELLALNWTTTFEARFAIFEEQVVVMSTRSAEDLSASEISRAITIVAGVADEQVTRLAAEFPG